MGLLKGKSAVVTGGAQGLGLAVARTFLAEGATVVIGDLDDATLTESVAELGERAHGVRCDVTSSDDVAALIEVCRGRWGGPDIVVNNAGITRDATLRKMSLEDFELVTSVHLRGTWLGLKHGSAAMRDQGIEGCFVNMSSISGKVGNPGQTNYSAAKAGIVGMTKAAAKELGHVGIRVNAIQPSFIRTAMVAKMDQTVLAARLKEIPLGRIGEPEDVANAALFLASPLASYLTGIVIEVAGGRNI
jgi:3-oxoacyl-[acyl-carrier protein] reductase